MRHEAGNSAPIVLTPIVFRIYRRVSEPIRHEYDKSTPNVVTPIIPTQTKDYELRKDEDPDGIRHITENPKPIEPRFRIRKTDKKL
jgi:hypothetical protein